MARYWSLDECCWVEYSSSALEAAEVSGAEGDGARSEQVPEQSGPAEREPAFL
jgi:hypothetical protein